jgi:hypothetical protein
VARKRATIEQRMEKLRGEIEALVADPSSSVTRRTLAGKRAALHVMEKAQVRGDGSDYCKAN